MYKLSRQTGQVLRIADGAAIPQDDGNVDYQKYQAWLAAGNVVAAADPAPAAVDYSDAANIDKTLRAVVLAAAALAGKTPAQARAAFKAAFDTLP